MQKFGKLKLDGRAHFVQIKHTSMTRWEDANFDNNPKFNDWKSKDPVKQYYW